MKTIMLALLLSVTIYAQQKPAPNQAVYVTALKTTGAPDFAVEKKLREEFSKQKTFKVAGTLAEADFVFVMYIEYEYNQVMAGGVAIGSEDIKSVIALTVTPSTYSEHKKDIDARAEQRAFSEQCAAEKSRAKILLRSEGQMKPLSLYSTDRQIF